MKLKIVLENGWMGDTLLACNVIRNLSDLGHEVVVFHKWPFMSKFIDLFEIIQNPTDMDLSDYKTINFTFHIDEFANPLTDYALSFGIENEYASKFYSVEPNLRKTYKEYNHGRPYITFDHDWQIRTNLNINYIIDKLVDIIDVIPIGGDRFTDDPDPLVMSGMILINSKLHLGMVGGTTNLAAFTNTKIIGSSDHLYRHFGIPRNMGEQDFLINFKPFPNHWADQKHIITLPSVTEDEFINIVKNNL